VADVRYWHLADNPTAPAFVRYWGNRGHRGCKQSRPHTTPKKEAPVVLGTARASVNVAAIHPLFGVDDAQIKQMALARIEAGQSE
jgi:hypothetical protein